MMFLGKKVKCKVEENKQLGHMILFYANADMESEISVAMPK